MIIVMKSTTVLAADGFHFNVACAMAAFGNAQREWIVDVRHFPSLV